MRKVHRIITELAVIDVLAGGLPLHEVARGRAAIEVQAATAARLVVAPDLGSSE